MAKKRQCTTFGASLFAVMLGLPSPEGAAQTPSSPWAIKHTIVNSQGQVIGQTPPFAYVAVTPQRPAISQPTLSTNMALPLQPAAPQLAHAPIANPVNPLSLQQIPVSHPNRPSAALYQGRYPGEFNSWQSAMATPSPTYGNSGYQTGQAALNLARPDGRGPLQQVAMAPRDGQEHRGPLFSEIRGALLYHDAGVFGGGKEQGVDVNTEVLFRSFSFMDDIGAPRPHVGLSINTEGNTSQLYTGLTWQFDNVLFDNVFVNLSLGLVVHTGKLTTNADDEKGKRKELGSRLLFRESLEFGYVFNNRHSVSLMLDHISNANTSSNNEGLDGLGVRYGYRF